MFQILLVEDNEELRKFYRSVLLKNGYQVHEAGNGREALALFEQEHIDLMICDVMMPGMDGFELAGAVRMMDKNLPIMMITVLSEYAKKEKGFELGVDDYLVKPIDVKEMVLRVKALLRRTQNISDKKLSLKNTHMEYDELRVWDEHQEYALTQKEFYLLYKLASYPNHIFTRYQLMDEIWGVSSESNPHTLEVYIGRLRERFKDNTDFRIVTIRGLGYKVELSDE